MVLKILRVNHKQTKAPKLPVTKSIAVLMRNMYPKYNKYVMSILDASKLLNQNTL